MAGRGGRQRGAKHAQRRGRRTAHHPATPSARSRQSGTGAAEAATPVGAGGEGVAPELASASPDDVETVAVAFGDDGFPLGVDAVPARSRAYWRQADL